MSRNSNYLGTQRCCYSKTPITGAQGAPGAIGPIGPFGFTGPKGATGAQGATGGSQWTATNSIGLQGYTGIGVTGMDVLIGGNLLVTGGIDPIYLALTPQPSGPIGFVNPLWVDNNGNLRSDKILLDNASGNPNINGTLTGTEFKVENRVNGVGAEKFAKITSTGLVVQDSLGAGYDPIYTNIGLNNIICNGGDDSNSRLNATQLAITNSSTSNIYTFGATGTQCQIDSSADHLVLNSGLLILNNIPTSNPGVTGALWNDGGFLKIA